MSNEDEVEGQLAMCIDIVVALVNEHRHAATGLATVVNDPLGQRLDLVAWNAPSTLKESADLAFNDSSDHTVDAREVLAVLVPGAVGDLGGDLLAQDLSRAIGDEDVAVG